MNPGKSVVLHPFRLVLNFSALQRDVIRMAADAVGAHDLGDHFTQLFFALARAVLQNFGASVADEAGGHVG